MIEFVNTKFLGHKPTHQLEVDFIRLYVFGTLLHNGVFTLANFEQNLNF